MLAVCPASLKVDSTATPHTQTCGDIEVFTGR
jgi:hypothetical protein